MMQADMCGLYFANEDLDGSDGVMDGHTSVAGSNALFGTTKCCRKVEKRDMNTTPRHC